VLTLLLAKEMPIQIHLKRDTKTIPQAALVTLAMQTKLSKPPTYPALPLPAAKRDHAPLTSTLHDQDVKFVFDDKYYDLVTWDGPNDPTNPQNWSKGYKWFLTMVCSFMSISV
jgi:hypothetical protein